MSDFLLGGRMGDLLHQLWVVKNTPGQHHLFLTDRRDLHSDGFQLPLSETMAELWPIVSCQEWFYTINAYIGEQPFGENVTGEYQNLNMWRRYVYSSSWTPLLARTYGREPNGEPWIVLPKIQVGRKG